MARVILTGASGYAGAAVLQALRADGIEVITAGRRLEDAIRLDLMNPRAIAELRLPQVDACIHAAAAHEVGCRMDPVSAWTANATATRALLTALARASVSRVAYLSTFHVYGSPAGEIDEQCQPVPATDYGMTHLAAEQMVRMYARQVGMRATVLRLTNLYGVPASWHTFDRWSLAPFDFARQAVRDGSIRLLSDGSPVRSYVSLEKLTGTVRAALQDQLPELTHVSGQPWSMGDLARLCAEVAGQTLNRTIDVNLGCGGAEGRTGSTETPYRFFSNHWPSEVDEPVMSSRMAEFLRCVVEHLGGVVR